MGKNVWLMRPGLPYMYMEGLKLIFHVRKALRSNRMSAKIPLQADMTSGLTSSTAYVWPLPHVTLAILVNMVQTHPLRIMTQKYLAVHVMQQNLKGRLH